MNMSCKNMKLEDIFNELQNCQEDVSIFRKLISNAPLNDPTTSGNVKELETILTHIIGIISNNSELGKERVLLASHAFYVLLPIRYNSQHRNCDIVMHFQNLDSRDLCFFEKRYIISDLELFKLLNAYGYLLANHQTDVYHKFEYDILLTIFDVIYRNCMKYTRYSYFAYKILYIWLKKTLDVCFWNKSNNILERKLEAIIFSNWSNALNDVCKQNAQIFNMYLRIMRKKYEHGFIDYIFYKCLDDISWQNETKYVILAEIFQIMDMKSFLGGKTSFMENYLYNLYISLTRNSLRCGGTKLYLVILRKLSEDEWKEFFGKSMKFVIDHWESGEHEDHNALQSLFKYWLEPTIETHRDILPFLWKLSDNSQGFFRSHLQRVAAKLRIELPQTDEIVHYINDKEEILRLNAFAVLCYRGVVDPIDINKADPFSLIKQFLWFNANVASILMREGIIKYFKILCLNILKVISVKSAYVQPISEFMKWLHEYFLDCFEIGSCYQRKILGLNLYKTLLSLTNEESHKNYAHRRSCLRYVTAIDKYLKTTESWRFTDKESLFLLLKLVLDSALDVRQLATTLIFQYFEKDVLSAMERRVLYDCAWEHCNSSKFYKIESGAALMKIIAYWLPLNKIREDVIATFSDNEHYDIVAHSSYSEFLLNEARYQLTQMKSDILKAIVRNKPFYGVLTALLAVAFHAGPENWILTLQFTEKILNLLNEAVDFFLTTLSTKTSDTVYSSSFAEMGLAIDEKIKSSEIENSNYDELQLSPAHQVLISCIWISLKVSCEIVSEIGMLMQSSEQVKYSMDIIVKILLKCRHKGVVESAGIAIANLSRHLYDTKEYSELPIAYLTCLLEEDTKKSLHLTRRGAGLSIMFHRLVISDHRRDRPTVHFAVQMLLRSLKNFSAMAVRNVETGQDSPWAKCLHFLRALVADKEIHAQLVLYIQDICLTCFEYMESDVWTVRNASLQLYGAVVPRLVGQCSGRGGKMLDFGDGHSVNHFVTHYPTLTNRMWAQLRDVSKLRETCSQTLRSYSSVAHTLILLSKLSIGGCDLIDYPAKTFATKVKSLLLVFLGNPMIYVRQLAAKTYAAFTPFKNIDWELEQTKKAILSSRDANMSHGYLLTYGYLRKKYIDNKDAVHPSDKIIEDYGKFGYTEGYRYFYISESWYNMYRPEKSIRRYNIQPCYVIETLFRQESVSEISCVEKLVFCNNLSVIECIASSQKIQPGFFQFVGHWARLYAIRIKCLLENGWQLDDYELEIICNILNSNCTEQSIEFVNGLSYCVPLLEFFLNYLISVRYNCHQLLLHEIVTFTLKTIKHAARLKATEMEFDKIIEELNEVEMSVVQLEMIRVKNSLTLAFSKCETSINEVLLDIFGTCMDEKQSARLTAVEYIEIALQRFAQLQDGNKITIMQCCLILLKDEIIEIREIVSMSLQKHAFPECTVGFTSRRPQHEEIVYQRLLSDIIRRQSDIAIANGSVDLIRYFTRAVRDIDCNATIENPFNHDDSTFHREESKFINICALYDFSSDKRNDCTDAVRAIQIRRFRKFQEKAGFNYNDLRAILYLKEMDYLVRKRNMLLCNNEINTVSVHTSHLNS